MLNVNVIALLAAGGLVVMLVKNYRRVRQANHIGVILPLTGVSLSAAAAAAPFSLVVLFLTFLKIGAVLYGSGYVLLAFLRSDFVVNLGWLTDRQLIDAIAIGQVTPGPVFTTATFIGYMLGGVPGALLATLGIFLPSFIFVGLISLILPRLRTSPWASAFLDGVNVAALGLMAGVAGQLALAALIDPLTIAIGLVSALLLLRFRVNSTWLILGGAAVGLFSVLVSSGSRLRKVSLRAIFAKWHIPRGLCRTPNAGPGDLGTISRIRAQLRLLRRKKGPRNDSSDNLRRFVRT